MGGVTSRFASGAVSQGRRVTGTPRHRDAASHVELACGSIAFLLPLLLDTCFTKGEVYAL